MPADVQVTTPFTGEPHSLAACAALGEATSNTAIVADNAVVTKSARPRRRNDWGAPTAAAFITEAVVLRAPAPMISNPRDLTPVKCPAANRSLNIYASALAAIERTLGETRGHRRRNKVK